MAATLLSRQFNRPAAGRPPPCPSSPPAPLPLQLATSSRHPHLQRHGDVCAKHELQAADVALGAVGHKDLVGLAPHLLSAIIGQERGGDGDKKEEKWCTRVSG